MPPGASSRWRSPTSRTPRTASCCDADETDDAVPLHPRARRVDRDQPTRRRRPGRRARLPLRGRQLRLLRRPLRSGQPRRQRTPAAGRPPTTASRTTRARRGTRRVPLRERVLGRRADGVRRRVRVGRRRGGPRADARRDRLHLGALLLPAVRRHQRVDVRHLRRAHRPHEHRRHRHRGRPLGDRRGRAWLRGDPEHEGPDRLRGPGPDAQPALLQPTRASRTAAGSTRTAGWATRRRT